MAAYLAGAESLPPAGFEPDMRGLKLVHEHLFGDVYEWAGCWRSTRGYGRWRRRGQYRLSGEWIGDPDVVSRGADTAGGARTAGVELTRSARGCGPDAFAVKPG